MIRKFFKDLVESKAIYHMIAVWALVALSIWVDTMLFTECTANGFSVFYCIMK